MSQADRPILYVVVCGAGPAGDVGILIAAAHGFDWAVHVIATPAGLGFLDVTAVEQLTGHPVRSAYRSPEEPRRSLPPADAIIVAPATFNTINKLAVGISDTYALGVLAESIGARVPMILVPFINSALAAREPLRAAVTALRREGVAVLLGDNGFQPHPPGTGRGRLADFPWTRALHEANAARLPKESR